MCLFQIFHFCRDLKLAHDISVNFTSPQINLHAVKYCIKPMYVDHNRGILLSFPEQSEEKNRQCT